MSDEQIRYLWPLSHSHRLLQSLSFKDQTAIVKIKVVVVSVSVFQGSNVLAISAKSWSMFCLSVVGIFTLNFTLIFIVCTISAIKPVSPQLISVRCPSRHRLCKRFEIASMRACVQSNLSQAPLLIFLFLWVIVFAPLLTPVTFTRRVIDQLASVLLILLGSARHSACMHKALLSFLFLCLLFLPLYGVDESHRV